VPPAPELLPEEPELVPELPPLPAPLPLDVLPEDPPPFAETTKPAPTPEVPFES